MPGHRPTPPGTPSTLRPNSILQSGLFGAIAHGPRKNLDKTQIPTLGGQAIKYTGTQLDQSDLDVYLAIISLARLRNAPLGKPIHIEDGELLGFIGRNASASDLVWLADIRTRLKANEVEVSLDAHSSYGGSLIQNWYHDAERQMTTVILDPLPQTLLDPGHWTSLCWEQRLALKGCQLAQWLHTPHTTHDTPHAYNVGELWALCGGEYPNRHHFRSELEEALSTLEKATHWKCRIDEYENVLVNQEIQGRIIDMGLPHHSEIRQ
jgi:hypothetical protein